MKNLFLLALTVTLFISCKQKTSEETPNYKEETLNVTTSIYPETITKVFDAHGGIDTWNKMNTLEFLITKPAGEEKHTTDLKTRKSIIDMQKHTIGFNGENVWLKNKFEDEYKGNPKFYYNLMFYFYAMPFVLADDGINYEEAEPLTFEGVTYPGIKISYEAGVGESPDDEYILYYNAETYQMEWLAYTVTFRSKTKSEKFSFIKYGVWEDLNGLKLPKTISWYKVEDNKPTELRKTLTFNNTKVDEAKLDASVFEAPEGSKIIE
ncbi:hypothetical protein PW52_14695 [Tamlana sedimentorum]|uniref:Threonine synthase n=1 Tax=Neotamlana sedimentorum TaxID=1435349 RepID=A0A0D7W3M2_9FLAO|nr:DUF6503 family protein [Tamlana sedimentorum]KJD33288.1 hypothetical protein PW52_14695 [Tamlana sedimentorum]